MKPLKVDLLVFLLAFTEAINICTAQTASSPLSRVALVDLTFISGSWRSEWGGGLGEEYWSNPSGDSMVGAFRFVKDGKARFYELMLIEETPEGLVLRLKHFNPGLIGWEEKTQVHSYALVEYRQGVSVFERGDKKSRLTFRRTSTDDLSVVLDQTNDGGKQHSEEFKFKLINSLKGPERPRLDKLNDLTTNITRNPADAYFSYKDVELFANAWKQFGATTDSVKLLDEEYINRGTPGLRAFVRKYQLTGKKLFEAIQKKPESYAAVPELVRWLPEQEGYFRAKFVEFDQLIPDAVFPPTYFLIEAHGGVASGSEEGQLVSVETRGKNVEVIGRFLIHELTHMQSVYRLGLEKYRAIFGPEKSLLAISIREGTAEFFCYRLMGKMTQERAREYVEKYEKELWDRFQTEMNGKETVDWMWIFPTRTAGQPSNVGYALGAKIVEAYYDNAKDKRKAISEILTVTDYESFLKKSGYAKKMKNKKAS